MDSNSRLSYVGTTTEGSSDKRWYWLDCLRVLAMGMIFLFHSTRPFVFIEWHVMNAQQDLALTVFNIFVNGWIMPLFFVISGMATYFSLAKRSPKQFMTDRFKRLMIPFLGIGLFVILPVHVYFDKIFHSIFTGSFLAFYSRRYFTNAFPFDFRLSPTYFANSNQGIYLWYLFWLFIFSLVTVHFFKWLRRDENRGKISKIAAACDRRGGIFLLAIPLIIMEIVAQPPYFFTPTGYGGWKLPVYLIFFILGYMLASDPKFEPALEKNRVYAVVVGVITSVIIVVIAAIYGLDPLVLSRVVPIYFIWPLNGWCWVTAILGFGRKLLNFNHRYLKSLNELVLPFYVLHQTVIVAIAFYVVGFDLSIIVKYLIIISASGLIISLLLFPIQQYNILRFLFGMRSKTRA